jgi:hypothetical protein
MRLISAKAVAVPTWPGGAQCLQTIDLATGADIEQLAALRRMLRHSAKRGRSGKAGKKSSANPTVQRAVELATTIVSCLSACLCRKLVEGFIDLLFEEKENWLLPIIKPMLF